MRNSKILRTALVGLGALLLGALAASCAVGNVKITKDATTMIGDQTVKWDGSASITAPGGYNQADLKKMLKESGVDPKKLEVTVTNDVRRCNMEGASVDLQGSYVYDGFKGEFDHSVTEKHPAPIPIGNEKNVQKRCNKTAAKTLAMGIARSLRDNDKI